MDFAIAALWYTFLSLACEGVLPWIVDMPLTYERCVMVAFWSFIFGGTFGASLLNRHKITTRRILGIGIAIPILVNIAAFMPFIASMAVGDFLAGQPDGLQNLLLSPLHSFLASLILGPGLFGIFFLIVPVGIFGSWRLSRFRK